MAPIVNIFILTSFLGISLAETASSRSDCTYATEIAPPRPTANGVLKIHTSIETVTEHIDCAGCSNVHTLSDDILLGGRAEDITTTQLVRVPSTKTVYECRKTSSDGEASPIHTIPSHPVKPDNRPPHVRDAQDFTTVSSTYTVSVWASTTTAVGIFNCTMPYYVQASSALAAVSARQTAAASTITAWAIATATQTGVLVNTAYACATTMEYILTTVATTTVSYTVTTYASTATPSSTVICPGIGGFPASFVPPGFGNVTLPTPTPTPTSGRAVETSHAILGADLIALDPDAADDLTTLATSTLSLTSTIYQAVTVQHAGIVTSAQYSCSSLPFDATSTFPLVFTEWATTATSYRYIYCRTTPTVTPTATNGAVASATGVTERDYDDPEEDVEVMKRQTASLTGSSTSYSFHRTSFVPAPTTVTVTAATTRLVYVCYTPAAGGLGGLGG